MTVELTSHKVNGLNDALEVRTLGPAGSGGAFHSYEIAYRPKPEKELAKLPMHFQEGPIGEWGVNGISNESLLAIVEHRLQCFQSGEYACRENAIALTKLQEAMHWLHHRTRERLARGVEGTAAK